VPSVVVVREAPVSLFAATAWAPTTTACELSVTVPCIVPLAVACPKTLTAPNTTINNAMSDNWTWFFILKSPRVFSFAVVATDAHPRGFPGLHQQRASIRN